MSAEKKTTVRDPNRNAKFLATKILANDYAGFYPEDWATLEAALPDGFDKTRPWIDWAATVLSR
jgi:hypothetical protein